MKNTTIELNRAISILGGLSATARILEVKTTSVVNGWRIHRVPAEYCPAIEGATNHQVTCEQLRPDVRWDIVRAGAVTLSLDPPPNVTAAPSLCAI
jgi:DNA-binding transcriptional regulator YdaS (Cro superfamily)